MSHDPDYVDPAVLKRRAAESGGAGVVSSRPRIRRTEESHGVLLRSSKLTITANKTTTEVGITIASVSR